MLSFQNSKDLHWHHHSMPLSLAHPAIGQMGLCHWDVSVNLPSTVHKSCRRIEAVFLCNFFTLLFRTFDHCSLQCCLSSLSFAGPPQHFTGVEVSTLEKEKNHCAAMAQSDILLCFALLFCYMNQFWPSFTCQTDCLTFDFGRQQSFWPTDCKTLC